MNTIKHTPRLLSLDQLDHFDDVSADDIESARQALSLTPPEMAESLNWSHRKYSRVLEAARETGAVDRDVALAIRGIMDVRRDRLQSPAMPKDDGSFLGGKSFETIFERLRENTGGWSAEIAPDLLHLLVERATISKSTTTYGEVATVLEERELTHRVWPRTAYGRPLGLLCDALHELAVQTGEHIPPISVIVTKTGGDPSDGIDGHVKNYLRLQGESTKQLKQDRSSLMRDLQEKVFNYPDWPGVVRALLGTKS